MLQNEFENLMGEVVTSEEYINANAMYMLLDDMNKEEFVEKYKRIRNMPLVYSLFEKARAYERKNKKQLERINDAVDLFLDIESDPNLDTDWIRLIEDAVETLVGRKKVIIKKCQKNYTLSNEQLDYVVQHLQ